MKYKKNDTNKRKVEEMISREMSRVLKIEISETVDELKKLLNSTKNQGIRDCL